jgi:hypothetical protein
VKRYRLWRLQGLNKLRTGVEAGLQTQTVAASDISECHRRMHELDIATVVQGVARQVEREMLQSIFLFRVQIK